MKNNLLKNVDKNLSKILLGFAVTGVFATAYFAVTGTFKAVDDIQEAKKEKEENGEEPKLEPREVAKICVKNHATTGIVAVGTAACMVCSWSEEARKATKALAGYEILSAALWDRDKLQSKFETALGPKKTQQLKEEHANELGEKMAITGAPERTTKAIGNEELILFKDVVQGREFWSTDSLVYEAFANFKSQALEDVMSDGFAYMDPEDTNYVKPWNDLNYELGIEYTEIANVMAYSYRDIMKLKPILGFTGSSTGKPCRSLWYDCPTAFA